MFTQPKWTILSCLLLLPILTSSAGASQLRLYDNFSSKHIDPAKWVGEPASIAGGSDKDRREVM